MDINETTCPFCGCKLDGTTFGYGSKWICSNCITNKTDVLHCERGCKVKVVNLDAGFDTDAKLAHKYLVKDKEYTVSSVYVGGWLSSIGLLELPDILFNTVHFVRTE